MNAPLIAEKLRSYFHAQGISQVEIANKLKVSKTYVNSLLTGKQKFGKKQAEKWEREFGISSSWLLTGQGLMFTSDSPNSNPTIEGNNSGNIIPIHNTIFEILQLINKKNEQIDQLISLLEINIKGSIVGAKQ